MLAAGGRCVADMAALRDQPDVFGEVASEPTIWRAFDDIDGSVLDSLRAARAEARATVWAAGATPARGRVGRRRVAGRDPLRTQAGSGVALQGRVRVPSDVLLPRRSGEALAGMFRPGNAAANSGADQLAVVDMAIAQLPAEQQRGHLPGDDPDAVVHPILVRADTAGAVRSFIDGLVARNCEFSISARVSDALDAAIAAVGDDAWRPAINPDGEPRRGAQIVELDLTVAGWPAGTRVIVRRERPHPGAQLRLWDHDGMRHQVVLTNQPGDAVASSCVTAATARSRTGSRTSRTADSNGCRSPSSPPTQRGWRWSCAPPICSCGARPCCSTANSPSPSHAPCATGSCTSPAGSIRRARRTWLRLPEHWPWTGDLLDAYRRLAAIT